MVTDAKASDYNSDQGGTTMEYVNARKGLGRLFAGTVFQIISRAMIEVSFVIMLIMNRVHINDANIYVTNDMVSSLSFCR